MEPITYLYFLSYSNIYFASIGGYVITSLLVKLKRPTYFIVLRKPKFSLIQIFYLGTKVKSPLKILFCPRYVVALKHLSHCAQQKKSLTY